MQTSTRPAAVAGMFYPGEPATLRRDLAAMLAHVPLVDKRCPKALLVPHAGYIYSGPTAAAAYAAIQPWRANIRRVVLLGPAHRVPLFGLAVPSAGGFATPLGVVPVDVAARDKALVLPQVAIDDSAHAQEHALEVQLPFLQAVLGEFSLLPIVVGQVDAAAVAEVIESLWGGPETLIVVSSDLSHYQPYATASTLDAQTCQKVLALDPHIAPDRACGAFALNGLLLAARHHHLRPALLNLRNSGDTAGDKARVVGYAAAAFFAEDDDV